nr:helix-turn-helix domain-containing protein [Sphingobium yanoikuyae]
MSSIGRRFDRASSSVFSVISPTGGIRPADRKRGSRALSLAEREEISRGLSVSEPLRAIARRLGRSPSTISREVRRNGGGARYRATASDQAAWDRALRPKPCKLACSPSLAQAVSVKLRRKWSPEQIAGWLRRSFPKEPHRQVSHETIYRSLYIQARGGLSGFPCVAGHNGQQGVPLCHDAKNLPYRTSFSISFWRAALPVPPSSRAVCSIR